MKCEILFLFFGKSFRVSCCAQDLVWPCAGSSHQKIRPEGVAVHRVSPYVSEKMRDMAGSGSGTIHKGRCF